MKAVIAVLAVLVALAVLILSNKNDDQNGSTSPLVINTTKVPGRQKIIINDGVDLKIDSKAKKLAVQ
jgi:hypothetical protein